MQIAASPGCRATSQWVRRNERMTHTLQHKTRTMLRLREIERLIKLHRILVPPPSRRALIHLCENGTFETVGDGPTNLGWLVYEDSFWKWVNGLG